MLRLRPAVDLVVLLVDVPGDVAAVLDVVRRRVDHRLEGLPALTDAAVPPVPAAVGPVRRDDVDPGVAFSDVVRESKSLGAKG